MLDRFDTDENGLVLAHGELSPVSRDGVHDVHSHAAHILATYKEICELCRRGACQQQGPREFVPEDYLLHKIAMGDGLPLLLNHMSHEIRCYSCGFILTRATSSSGTSIDEATAVDLHVT